MDASLEIPTTKTTNAADARDAGDEESSSGDEGGLDWTKIAPGLARPVIPKRGEKEFEPARGGASGLQAHNLERARSAMFSALSATRSISSKNVSYGIWFPDIARVHVTQARGFHFGSMGHSFPRVPSSGQSLQKRLELLPEEALYLIERGALLCCKHDHVVIPETSISQELQGTPISVQQAFSEMIGKEGLTLEHYQVFAYLKRLGYALIRAELPSPHYPTPSPSAPTSGNAPSLLQRITSILSRLATRVCRLFTSTIDWWKPVIFHHWMHHNKSYASVFKSLRFIPSSHYMSPPFTNSPYRIFFHVYKPSTPFRKTSPPTPDFSIVVVNAQETSMPSLPELTALFDCLPDATQQLRPPRHRPTSEAKIKPTPQSQRDHKGFWHSLKAWFSGNQIVVAATRKPNPFVHLKTGRKAAIVAVVDSGAISFFRFGQGVFSEWPIA